MSDKPQRDATSWIVCPPDRKSVVSRFIRACRQNSTIHDFWDVCEHAPKHLILTPTSGFRENSDELNRLLRGDWPAKRNIVVSVWSDSIEPEAGRELVRKLRASVPRF